MRWRWMVTWALCAAVMCGLLLVWPLRDPARISAAAAVLSAVVALFGVLSVWAWRAGRGRVHSSSGQAADAVEVLARTVRRQWEEEAILRQLYDPAPLPLAWSDCSHPGVSDHRQLVGTAVVCRAGDPQELAAAFGSLPRRRLVVLGAGGSGKTTFTVLLLLALLRTRTTDDPVPVLFSLSSFDPARESARNWLRRRIAADYPAIADTETYGASVIEDLLTEHRLIPVLDGLDELPERRRAAALASLNDTLPSDAPLVLTCRTADYVRAVTESGILTGAAVLEPAPVRTSDALALLRLATPPESGRQHGWNALAEHLDHHPQAPAAQALTSPLMVALARSVYADNDGDPAELVDTRSFSTPADIERHLLGALVPTLYRRARRQSPTRSWDPRQAQGYLAHLAAGMHAQGTYDLMWWQLYRWTPALAGPWRRAWTWTSIACAGLLLATSFLVMVQDVPSWPEALRWFPQSVLESFVFVPVLALSGLIATRERSLPRASAVAAVISLSGGLALPPSTWWYYRGASGPVLVASIGFLCFSLWLVMLGAGLPSPPRTPSRSSPARRHWGRQAIRALVLVVGVAVISVTVFASYTIAGYEAVLPLGTVPWGLVIGTVAGVSLAALDWVRDPSTADDVATAASSVQADRLVSLISGAACAVVFVIPDAAMRAVPWVPADPLRTTMFAAVVGLFHGGIMGLVVALAAHSWPHYTVARLLLAARGKLPWRLQAFLADAHRLGILRQVGPGYQFRHARLQQHLATHPGLPAPNTSAAGSSQPRAGDHHVT
ncbi:NACHT domain-containing protein [Streptomyces griseocarneus]|uniref:NACHT domain-containing protein n=2 Tax=Streptomyces TaxID=1883 RepID=A0ABX7RLR5_9ACTN|nr:NACHT domain-containing protein [Streptomyces griseocarneus]QSY49127.1 NACHT domain-containing protein [Streptomyces griseocarneus]